MRFHHRTIVPLFPAAAGILSMVLLFSPALPAQAPPPPPASESKTPTDTAEKKRAEAYYNFAMGHYAEKLFESAEQEEQEKYATQALEYYKKAYALDPASPVIGERLAEMYWKAQRIRDAVKEAVEVLERNPNDLPTRRLLARIYLRSLGDLNGVSGQPETLRHAAEQYREILRLDPSDTESALWLARLDRLQNASEEAEQVLRRILKREPENEPALEQLTQLLLDEGKSAEAVSLLEGLTQHSPSAALLELLGDAYTQAKNLAKAEGAYRKAAELDPSDAGHQRGLGQTLLSEEKYAEALGVYQRLAELEPENADVFLRLSQIYRELHKLDEAEKSLLKARQRAPGSIEVMYNEALLYQSQGRFEDAIRVLSDTVTGIRSRSAGAPESRRTLGILYQQLGQLYRESQKYQAAIYSFQELQSLGAEEDRRARFLMIDTWRAAKDLPKALDEAKRATEKYPDDSGLRASYAFLCGENGQLDQGVQILRSQLTKTAADRDTYLNLAQLYERARRYKEAEESARLAEALPGQPRDNEMVWYLLGAIYERQKLFDRAETEFQKVLGINPRNASVLNYYGYMLGDLGIRLEEAHALVERALAEEPYNGAYLDSLGWIYFKQNKLADAETALRRALEREGHDPTIHAHLGEVYFRTGRQDLAAAEWEKSLAEWRRALPSEREPDKMAELEKKLTQVKHRVAAQKPAAEEAKPQ
jgi:tetratricopeptide (TPR) repeat protein